MPPQYRVLVPEHDQLGIFRPVAPEHQDGKAEYPAREQVDDLEQHLASRSFAQVKQVFGTHDRRSRDYEAWRTPIITEPVPA
jgi:hypothetical protein